MKNFKKPEGCFLCEALKQKDDRKNHVLHRTRHSCVIMNIYPYNNGHLLIAPHAHVPDIELLTTDQLCDLMKVLQLAVTVLKKNMKPEGFNVGINIGKVAGAGLPEHLHIQVVPRWAGDTNFMTVCDNTRVIPELLDGTYDRLKPYFEKLRSQEPGVRSTGRK